MSQSDLIKQIIQYSLVNDQDNLLNSVNDLVGHFKNTRKTNLALQIQSIVKEARTEKRNNTLVRIDSPDFHARQRENAANDLILEKLRSDYTLKNIVCSDEIKSKLDFFVQEHFQIEKIRKYNLPISNKVLFHGPSGCGKTLASYVLAGELEKLMVVVNLGAVVSSKLGETSKNLATIFHQAIKEDCIIFIDEFDSLGKIRDYNQDHGEMKRVVNTILQLFDYLPQESMVIAATNQVSMIDDALLRRFDLSLGFEIPGIKEIKQLVNNIIKPNPFKFDSVRKANNLMKKCQGLSYYIIQKTLITAIKRTLLNQEKDIKSLNVIISTDEWSKLIESERIFLHED